MASEKAFFCLAVQWLGLIDIVFSLVVCSVIDVVCCSKNGWSWCGSLRMQWLVCEVRRNVCIATSLQKQDNWAKEREPEIPESSQCRPVSNLAFSARLNTRSIVKCNCSLHDVMVVCCSHAWAERINRRYTAWNQTLLLQKLATYLSRAS
jgi:hypothetical protein